MTLQKNRPSKSLKAMSVGDVVEVTLDNGSKAEDVCYNTPTIVCGTWCAWLEKRGCYMLTRCKILRKGGTK